MVVVVVVVPPPSFGVVGRVVVLLLVVLAVVVVELIGLLAIVMPTKYPAPIASTTAPMIIQINTDFFIIFPFYVLLFIVLFILA